LVFSAVLIGSLHAQTAQLTGLMQDPSQRG
jgi:hypothetical protein